MEEHNNINNNQENKIPSQNVVVTSNNNALLIVIIAILVLLLIAAAFYIGLSLNKQDDSAKSETIAKEESVKNGEDKMVYPNRENEKVELAGVELSIADVTLSDNRDFISDIRVLVNPIEDNATRDWEVSVSLRKDGISEASFRGDIIPTLRFSNITSPTKISLSFFWPWMWDPPNVLSGDYDLVLEIRNKNTDEILATISKKISMRSNSPKVQ